MRSQHVGRRYWIPALILLLILGVGAPAAGAETADRESMTGRTIFDATVLRPLGALRLVIGSVLLVPVTLINGIMYPVVRERQIFDESVDVFVGQPLDYLINRPSGGDFPGG